MRHWGQSRWGRAVGSACWALFWAQAAQAGKSSLQLPDVLLSGRTGPEASHLVRTQARLWVRLKRERLTSREKAELVADCVAKPAENLFCEKVLQDWRLNPQPRSEASLGSEAVHLNRESLVEAIRGSYLDLLTQADETRLHRALRAFPTWEELQPLVKKLLSRGNCMPPSLPTALAQKAEEFFPDETYRRDAARLYERAVDCTDSGNAGVAAKARFRLALLRIWDGDCKAAAPLLQHLVSSQDVDFNARALYWQASCSKTLGDSARFSFHKAKIREAYPLSFHSLALMDSSERQKASEGHAQESLLQFRSQARPYLNDVLASAEYLQAQNEPWLSAELLQAYSDRWDAVESGVRMYVSVLHWRAGDSLGVFRTLGGLFRDDPASVSRSALEIFYPLRNFQAIQAAAKPAVDPLLLAALIRQESGFNPRARSIAGAQGLMQLMPDTARRMGGRSLSRKLMDPVVNVKLGARYFRSLLERFDGDAELSLAAYNAGPEKVDDWRRRYAVPQRMLFLDLIPYQETRNYVALIGRNYFWYSQLYGTPAPTVLPDRVPAKARPWVAKVALGQAGSDLKRFPSLRIE